VERQAREAPRTLRIEPRIQHVEFITGGKRFRAGAFAGGSAVLMTVKLTDAATGDVVAGPAFSSTPTRWARRGPSALPTRRCSSGSPE
jgi:hypothetical protein